MASVRAESGGGTCDAAAQLDSAEGLVTELLTCPICMDVVQLPVNLMCFRGCPGTRGQANQTCLRGVLCQHCANRTLQLDTSPGCRFAESGGAARCIICRSTQVDARTLSPATAYHVDHTLIAVMDALRLPAECRMCEADLASHAELHAHYMDECPYAVVTCKHSGCPETGMRMMMEQHQSKCKHGCTRCVHCSWLVQTDLMSHHVREQCPQRIAQCTMCGHRARLPQLLKHLVTHQAQLQSSLATRGGAVLPARAAPCSTDSFVAATTAPPPLPPPHRASYSGGSAPPAEAAPRLVSSDAQEPQTQPATLPPLPPGANALTPVSTTAPGTRRVASHGLRSDSRASLQGVLLSGLRALRKVGGGGSTKAFGSGTGALRNTQRAHAAAAGGALNGGTVPRTARTSDSGIGRQGCPVLSSVRLSLDGS